MKVADVMTRAVVTVRPDATVADAIRLMLDQKISGVPVVDDTGWLVGILTEGDLLRRVETGTERQRPKWLELLRSSGRKADEYVRERGRAVADLMTRDVASVGEDAALDEVVAMMEDRSVRRVPVVTNGRLVGIVSRADLLRTLAKAMDEPVGEVPADLAMREQIVAEFRRQSWGSQGQVTVVVVGGVAYLEGVVYDPRVQDAMRVAAANVPGVKGVQDHIEYADPYIGLGYGV